MWYKQGVKSLKDMDYLPGREGLTEMLLLYDGKCRTYDFLN